MVLDEFGRTLEDMLRDLFRDPWLYTVDELVELTGHKEPSIRVKISELQNPKRCGDRGPVKIKFQRDDAGVKLVGGVDAAFPYGAI
jgi:hypothetical protein